MLPHITTVHSCSTISTWALSFLRKKERWKSAFHYYASEWLGTRNIQQRRPRGREEAGDGIALVRRHWKNKERSVHQIKSTTASAHALANSMWTITRARPIKPPWMDDGQWWGRAVKGKSEKCPKKAKAKSRYNELAARNIHLEWRASDLLPFLVPEWVQVIDRGKKIDCN